MRPLPLNEPEIPITWTWCLKHLLINLVFWLLLFGIVLMFAYYTQEDTSLGGLKQVSWPGDENASI